MRVCDSQCERDHEGVCCVYYVCVSVCVCVYGERVRES